MDFAPTAWVVQTLRAYPELAVFLANRRTAEASVSGGELGGLDSDLHRRRQQSDSVRTLLAGREVGRGTAGAPLDRTRQAANLVVTSMVIRSRVKRVALTSFHQPARRFLAREAIILLGCLLLAAALWSWGGADDDGRILPAVSGGDAHPVDQWGAAVRRSGDGPPVDLDGCAAVEASG